MPILVELVPNIPEYGSKGRKPSPDKFLSTTKRMQDKLLSLRPNYCLTILPETDDPKELERKRTHWSVAANRGGIPIVTRMVITETGDRALRIWRKG